MVEMIEVDGIRYTPNDLAAKTAREEAARERQRELAAQAARAADDVEDSKVAKAIELALAPYEERLAKLEALIGDLPAQDEPDVAQGDPAGVPDAEAPQGAALTSSTANPEEAPESPKDPEPEVPAKKTRGGGKK